MSQYIVLETIKAVITVYQTTSIIKIIKRIVILHQSTSISSNPEALLKLNPSLVL